MLGGHPALEKEMRSSEVGGVVLAAGLSQRFGRNKLLAEFGGRPMISWTVAAALASRLAPVVVVLGYEQPLVKAALAEFAFDPRLIFAINDDYRLGQSASVKAGLASLPAHCAAAMFVPADQPRLTPAVIDRLIEEFEKGQASICYPTFAGRRCSPVLFAAAHFPSILRLQGDVGARGVIKAHPECVAEVAFAQEGPLLDVDNPEDALALASMTERPGQRVRTAS